MPVYSLSTTARRIRRLLSSDRFRRRTQFLLLGLFWGLVVGGLNSYQLFWLTEPSPMYHEIDLRMFVVFSIIVMVPTCLIATLIGSARLKREHSSTRWTLNWVITAFASSAAVIAILFQIAFFVAILSLPPDVLFSHPTSDVEAVALSVLLSLLYSAVYGIFVGIECAVLALILAPLSLIARRLILRRAGQRRTRRRQLSNSTLKPRIPAQFQCLDGRQARSRQWQPPRSNQRLPCPSIL